MDPTYELISEQVLTSNQSVVNFNNIPQGYKHLYFSASVRSDRSSAYVDIVGVRFNNSTINYSHRIVNGNSSLASSATASSGTHTFAWFVYANGPLTTSNTFATNEVYIPNYNSNISKSYSTTFAVENNSSTANHAFVGAIAGLWADTSPITSISLIPGFGSVFISGSSFQLYGIKNADDGGRGFFGPAMTGGDEVYTTGNGYKVHVFKNSGTLNVTAPGEIEYLVVAGGGGGGSGANSGGGGAGGMRTGLLPINSGNYSVIIGAGGSQGSSDGVRGNSGNNSILSTISSIGGGGGGSTGSGAESVGRDGGSGGGGGLYGVVGGNGISGQGNNGGTSQSGLGGRYSAGGGGGAGAVGGSGGTASVSTDGTGGNGIATSISGMSTFYAGGGGGGSNFSSGGPLGGSGGGGRGGNSSPSNASTAGAVNTGGGGGGGASSNTSGSSGGSGIVIIRYRI